MIKKYALLALMPLFLAACGGKDPAPAQPDDKDDGKKEEQAIPIHQDGEPYDTYRGLVMAGYQGWFGTPDDGSLLTKNANTGWYHYRENDQFRPGVLRNSIDFWPDMSEYEKKYVVGEETNPSNSAPFILPDGSHASVFSSYDESTVMLHFKWMKDYGIDGVWMQRFVGEISASNNKEHFDKVLDNAMKASNQYGRAIAVMYDMSGRTTVEQLRTVVSDARALMKKYALNDRSKQKFYLYENGKPLIALWGVGLNTTSHPRPSVVKEIMDQLKNQGWSVFLGGPAYWREGGGDCVTGDEWTKLLDLFKESDGFFPWNAGRYDNGGYKGTVWQERIKKDIAMAKSFSTEGHVVPYALHVFPGFSWRNMYPDYKKDNPDETRTGDRLGGQFLWNQFYYGIRKGAEAFYVGMFDEIDEGTAIFKMLRVKDVPSNVYDGPDYWVNYLSSGKYTITDSQQTSGVNWSQLASSLNVTFQGIDNDRDTDWYLWLTGQGAKMLRGEKELTVKMPEK